MQTRTTYRQLQSEESMTIATMRLARSSVRAIARTLERSPATISRELERNPTAESAYGSLPAQALSQSHRTMRVPRPSCTPTTSFGALCSRCWTGS